MTPDLDRRLAVLNRKFVDSDERMLIAAAGADANGWDDLPPRVRSLIVEIEYRPDTIFVAPQSQPAATVAAAKQIIEGLPDPVLADYERRAEAAMRLALQQVMDTVADRIVHTQTASLDVLLAHLPGKHDQSTHGHGYGNKNWAETGADAETHLAAVNGSPLKSSMPLGGGLSASVKVEEHEKGSLVRKDFPDSDAIRAPEKQVAAEVLGSQVAHAMGINAPAVHQVGDHSVVMEHVHGKTWAEQHPYSNPPESIVDSPQGRMLGLFDVLAANPDRNHGNWMTDEHGNVVGIDHGLAFGSWSAGVSSPFAGHLVNAQGNNWAESINISPNDMATLKTRLGSLKPSFDASGHTAWHDDMMERLDALAPRAAGTEDVL